MGRDRGTTAFHDQYGELFGLVLTKSDSSSRGRFWHRTGEPDVVLPVDDLVASEDEFRDALERCLVDPDVRMAIGHEVERVKAAAA